MDEFRDYDGIGTRNKDKNANLNSLQVRNIGTNSNDAASSSAAPHLSGNIRDNVSLQEHMESKLRNESRWQVDQLRITGSDAGIRTPEHKNAGSEASDIQKRFYLASRRHSFKQTRRDMSPMEMDALKWKNYISHHFPALVQNAKHQTMEKEPEMTPTEEASLQSEDDISPSLTFTDEEHSYLSQSLWMEKRFRDCSRNASELLSRLDISNEKEQSPQDALFEDDEETVSEQDSNTTAHHHRIHTAKRIFFTLCDITSHIASMFLHFSLFLVYRLFKYTARIVSYICLFSTFTFISFRSIMTNSPLISEDVGLFVESCFRSCSLFFTGIIPLVFSHLKEHIPTKFGRNIADFIEQVIEHCVNALRFKYHVACFANSWEFSSLNFEEKYQLTRLIFMEDRNQLEEQIVNAYDRFKHSLHQFHENHSSDSNCSFAAIDPLESIFSLEEARIFSTAVSQSAKASSTVDPPQHITLGLLVEERFRTLKALLDLSICSVA